MNRALLLVAAVSLSGCVGVITMYNPTKEYPPQAAKLGGRGWCCNGSKAVTTKDEVKSLWGLPDKSWTEGDSEFWRYEQKALSWVAVMPVIILPIPLGIPTGHNHTTIQFTGQQIAGVQSEDREGVIALCGWFMNDANANLDFGCIAD